MYYSMLKKHSVHMAACKSESFERQFSNRRQCDRKFEQEVPKSMKETVKVLVNFMKNSDPEKLHKKDVLAKELNVLGFGKIVSCLLIIVTCQRSVQPFFHAKPLSDLRHT